MLALSAQLIQGKVPQLRFVCAEWMHVLGESAGCWSTQNTRDRTPDVLFMGT